jgi:hypothetical protein
MSKLINISIDVTKIQRDKIIAHKNGGKYVSLDVWVNDEPDQYGKDCSVNISQTKEEREAKDRKVYCGNGKKLFGFGNATPPPQTQHDTAKANAYQPQEDDIDDVPF